MGIMKNDTLGFPSPLLGESNLRIEVIAQNEHFLALNKPPLISVRQHPWEDPVSNLDSALNAQLGSGKPEWVATGAETFGSIYFLDHALSGVALFGKNKKSIAELRNAYGSGDLYFNYCFVALSDAVSEDIFENNTPLLKHRYKSKMIPSTAKGKQSKTLFKCLSKNKEGWSLWEAVTHYPRPHQIRLHASLSGLKVLGDDLYRGEKAPSFASIGKWKKEGDREKGIFTGLAVHLKSVHFEDFEGKSVCLEAALPKPFKALFSHLGLKIPQ